MMSYRVLFPLNILQLQSQPPCPCSAPVWEIRIFTTKTQPTRPLGPDPSTGGCESLLFSFALDFSAAMVDAGLLS